VRRKPIPNITLDHAESGESVKTVGQTADMELKFGDSFNSAAFGIDKKGHVATKEGNSTLENHTLTLPELKVEEGERVIGEVITGLEVENDGTFTINKAYIGNLELTEYVIGGALAIEKNDNIDTAFGKL
jgi:hypothetical protein